MSFPKVFHDTLSHLKTLVLVRHAKSSWDNPDWSDFERPLNNRGLRDAPLMAVRFAKTHGEIDLIISSPAKRAITTAEYFAKALGRNQDSIVKTSDIYEAPVQSLIQVVCSISDEYTNVILFGHNPGFSLLTNYLTEQSIEMSTCSIASIKLHVESWKHTTAGCGRLVDFDYPKKY